MPMAFAALRLMPPRRYRSAAAGGDQDIGATLHHSGYSRVGAGGYPFNIENNVLASSGDGNQTASAGS